MPLGNSITAGDVENGSYRLRLWQLLDSAGVLDDFVGSLNEGPEQLPDKDHEGHWGWHISQFYPYIQGWIADSEPDKVLLMAGTNDLFGWMFPDEIAMLLDSVLTLIFASARPGVEVFVSEVPPTAYFDINRRARDYNAHLATLVSSRRNSGFSVSLVPLYDFMRTGDLYDDLHPGESGNRKIAQAWFCALMGIDRADIGHEPCAVALKPNPGPAVNARLLDVLGRTLTPVRGRASMVGLSRTGTLRAGRTNRVLLIEAEKEGTIVR